MRTVVLKAAQSRTGPLILVNRQHPLAAPSAGALTAVDSRRPEILLDRQAARLLAACLQRIGGTAEIVPVSGWRSQDEQQRIWDDTLAESGADFTRKYVAYPGCSEHQTGLAIDLGQAAEKIDFIRPAFPYDGICGAFRQAAADYGFIERYQPGKESLTGIAPEPWHFRYVGVPHARLMVENGLCLEEYVTFLRRQSRTCGLPGGQRALVFHVPCAGEETELQLPEGCCQISGDNAGGFIVTVWERSA